MSSNARGMCTRTSEATRPRRYTVKASALQDMNIATLCMATHSKLPCSPRHALSHTPRYALRHGRVLHTRTQLPPRAADDGAGCRGARHQRLLDALRGLCLRAADGSPGGKDGGGASEQVALQREQATQPAPTCPPTRRGDPPSCARQSRQHSISPPPRQPRSRRRCGRCGPWPAQRRLRLPSPKDAP